MRVLIAYDGSESADQAPDLVAAMQWPPRSDLRLVTAYAPYLPGSFSPDEFFDPSTPEAVFEADREAAEGCAKTAAERIGRTDVWPFPAMLIPAGTIAAADSCRVRRHLAAATVGWSRTRHPNRSRRIRQAPPLQPRRIY